MSINNYYRDELSYLREMGNLFAKANPRLSRYLAREASDPDVERLMEGFAFLVGRLRQRLDAEMPELSLSLLQLIWPHYLRPVPPMTMVQFRFAEGASGDSIEVPRGTYVQSAPVDGAAVPFATSYGMSVLPLEVASVDLDNRKNSSQLTMGFKRLAGTDLHVLSAGPLNIFFNSLNDSVVSRLLYLFFMEKIASVTFRAEGIEPTTVNLTVEPLGFAADEATLDYPQGSFHGFRILQEYFACPEKFMCVRLRGLEAFAGLQVDEFSLSIEMSAPFPGGGRLTPQHFALNTTPAVNLFQTEGRALTVSHERSEYPVRPMGDSDKFSVHAINSAVGWVQGSGARVDYEPFEKFHHDQKEDGVAGLYFRTQVRPSVLGRGIDHYLSFVTRLGKIGVPESETVSMQLLCSNGQLASKLGVGTINQPTSTTPAKLEYTNITPVLSEVPPPLEDGILWTLIANLARNFASMIDLDALRTVVGAYDFRALLDHQAAMQRNLLLQSFHGFERRGVDIIRQGRPVRGFEVVLSVSEKQMGGEGEMYLFGTIFDRFLKSYSTINSLHRFTMVGTDANVVYKWRAKWGEAATL